MTEEALKDSRARVRSREDDRILATLEGEQAFVIYLTTQLA